MYDVIIALLSGFFSSLSFSRILVSPSGVSGEFTSFSRAVLSALIFSGLTSGIAPLFSVTACHTVEAVLAVALAVAVVICHLSDSYFLTRSSHSANCHSRESFVPFCLPARSSAIKFLTSAINFGVSFWFFCSGVPFLRVLRCSWTVERLAIR